MARRPGAARRYNSRHQALANRLKATLQPGTPCRQDFPDGTICGKPMYRTQDLQLGHAKDGHGYLGLVHASCNESAGAQYLALSQGKTLRTRTCDYCGAPYTASSAQQRTCSRTHGARMRYGRPPAPASTGREW